jgi:hypothetical protein
VIDCLATRAFDRQALEPPGFAQFAAAAAASNFLHFFYAL